MANKLSVSGDVNHILVEDKETKERTLISCGDWTKAEELGVTEYAKEVWTDELVKKFEDMQASLAPTLYIEERKRAYPSMGDQLDDLYKKGAFSTEMAAKLKKVKDDNPKS